MNMYILIRAVAMMLCLALVADLRGVLQANAAYAQDDDDDGGDDDDDGGDDDGGGGGGGGGNTGGDGGSDDDAPARPRTDDPTPTARPATRRVVPAAPQIERPLFARNELVTLSLNEADLATLLARGYVVLEEREVPQLGTVSRRLSAPDGTSLEEARAEVRGLGSGTDADFNHYYRSEEGAEPAVCDGPHCASFELIGWQAAATVACTADVVIGVVDTGINPDHPTFAGARLEVHKMTPGEMDPSSAIHGTAVTAVLIGGPDTRSPGLLPGARVVAVDAFHNTGGDERADVFTLVAAMDYLAEKGIRVMNLSLAGPPNTVLEQSVDVLSARGVVLIAAAGNNGPEAEPAYPGAYPAVVAVTAVDRNGTVYRRAGQGAHVDLAAPGVEIWTAASVKGARPKTGTSFAAPFVSAAAAAQLAANPELTANEVIQLLTG
ncbi:MAG: S8 family serine peptidase, partial [Paracoccaceae bacterium]